MKKTLFVFAFVAAASAAFAQVDMNTKRGESILPQAGDWAIGVDAMPFLNYAGNLLNGTSGNSSPSFNSPVNGFDSEVILYGKYVKDASTHYRGKLRIGFGSDKTELPTDVDSVNGSLFTAPPQFGVDEYKLSGNGIMLGVGIEKRKGSGRLQGYYGPEVSIGFGSSKGTHTYANAITDMNQNPSTSPLWGSGGIPGNSFNNGRITETKYGSNFVFSLRAFAGVEYFFMAHASIGAEFGWGVSMNSSGATEVTTERWGHPAGDSQLYTETVSTEGKQSGFHLDTDVDGGSDSMYASIRLLFYFGGGEGAN